MEIYYLVIAFSFLCCFFDFVKFKTIYSVVFFLISFLLICFAGFRQVGVDNDSINYSDMFDLYTNVTLSQIIKGGYGFVEPGYVWFNHVVYQFGGDFNSLLFIMSLMTGIANFYFFYKHSQYRFLCLLFYICFFYYYRDFTQIRYAFACGLIFWVVHFTMKKEWSKAGLLFLIAYLFHNAVLIILPALLFSRFFSSKILYLVLPFLGYFLGKFVKFLPLLISFGFNSDHMSIYLDDKSGGSLSISIIGYVFVITYYFLQRKIRSRDEENNSLLYWKLLSLGVTLNLMTIEVSIFQRFSFLLFQFAILLLPFIVEDFKKVSRRKETFLIFYFTVAFLLLFYGMRMIDEGLIRPYLF